jgi:hypothetical protein
MDLHSPLISLTDIGVGLVEITTNRPDQIRACTDSALAPKQGVQQVELAAGESKGCLANHHGAFPVIQDQSVVS